MRMDEIMKGIEIRRISGAEDAEVAGVAYDSRKVLPGHLFVAVRGENADGHDFIQDAIKRGAVGVVCEKEPENSQSLAVPVVRVDDSRAALAAISNGLYGRPSGSLCCIGVTGTNGKTTTTYLIKSVLESWGKKVGLIGTIQYMIGDESCEAEHTTPEALEFQGLLYKMRMSGCTHVVSEVSSHALAQKRVDGTVFRTGVFTNLTRDHLDFHKTMEDYFCAKKRLFKELLDGVPVINYDDPYGRRLLSDIAHLRPGLKKSYTYGLEKGSDFMAAEIKDSFEGLRFKILTEDGVYEAESSLIGLPNVYNILAAVGASVSLGVPWDVILTGIKDARPVKGRFERIDAGQKFLAIVDYAHTEDALERLIYTARGLTEGKIITVFGCGGDRDSGKRPKLGAIATRLSDFVVITSDNPRSEKPEKIINEIEAGVVKRNYLVEPERREAIKRAVLLAGDNDVVLVAGKGHESSQVVGGRSFHFNDREVLEEAIKQLVGGD
jgi:UDP-N-acetylmuramoyl-L-alanyl-D-glutamate--2,6-diaminopimelate ligase